MKQDPVAAGWPVRAGTAPGLVNHQVTAKALGRADAGGNAQYLAIALVVAVSAVFVMRRQFPNATRRASPSQCRC